MAFIDELRSSFRADLENRVKKDVADAHHYYESRLMLAMREVNEDGRPYLTVDVSDKSPDFTHALVTLLKKEQFSIRESYSMSTLIKIKISW